MKKNICILAGAVFAIAIYWLGFVNGVYYTENKTEIAAEDDTVLSDDEMLNKYVEEHYGSGCYAVVFDANDDYVYYDVYSNDGALVNSLCVTLKSWILE
jgi:hypothetical protein